MDERIDVEWEETESESEITMEEVETAVKQMKVGKAAGMDELCVEMIKAAGPVGLQWLYRLFRCIWKEKLISSDCSKGVIIPIFKKGDKKICDNYRGITLMSQVAKVFERILEK